MRLLCVSTVLLACVAGGVWPLGAQATQSPSQQDFATWLEGVRVEALERGIRPETVARALASVEAPEAVVVARDRAQPEQVQSLDRYVQQRVTTQVRRTANTKASAHATVLTQIERRFGVPAEVIVAIWGLESNFGRFTGTRPTVAALATLAYDPRRATLFRQELFHALTILDEGHIGFDELKGSWAGAMGQPQFMPSSYRRHAVDIDGDGRANIWTSEADVFGSIANYLKNAGWVSGERWGREVRISKDVMARVEAAVPMRTTGCRAVREMTEPRPLAEWTRVGVLQANGRPLPTAAMEASLVRGVARHFLVYRNYDAFIDYNCAHSYAISAGLLSDAVR
jgi:membrane-bound lytic murein transglycosylase B